MLGEEKMLNINKKQTTSPASKKPSQEGGKVSVPRPPVGVGAGVEPLMGGGQWQLYL